MKFLFISNPDRIQTVFVNALREAASDSAIASAI